MGNKLKEYNYEAKLSAGARHLVMAIARIVCTGGKETFDTSESRFDKLLMEKSGFSKLGQHSGLASHDSGGPAKVENRKAKDPKSKYMDHQSTTWVVNLGSKKAKNMVPQVKAYAYKK